MGKNTESAPNLSNAFFSDQVICIHVDTLIFRLKEAVYQFFDDAKENQVLSVRITEANGKTYAKIPIAKYEEFMHEMELMKASKNLL